MGKQLRSVLSLVLWLLPAPGLAACFILSTLTWSDLDVRSWFDPSGLWSIAAAGFLVLGLLIARKADNLRPRPKRFWQFLPGLDSGYVERVAHSGSLSPAPWIIAGRVVWLLTIFSLVGYVFGTSVGLW